MAKQWLIGAVAWLITIVAAADESADQRAHNWHQWRGPEATGVAPQGDPPIEWSETQNIKWKREIPGRGGSTPIVWGDRIFILTAIKTDRVADAGTAAAGNETPVQPAAFSEPAESPAPAAGAQVVAQREEPTGNERREGDGRGRSGRGGRGGGNRWGITTPTNYHQFVVLCLDRQTGDTLWQKVAADVVPHEGHHPTCSFAPASPVTDGKLLWAWFGSRGLHCYDLDGNRKWSKDFGDQQTANSFGEGASIALHEDTLIVPWDHEGESFIMALDARTGEEKWKKEREEETTWSTPLIVAWAGRHQVITNGSERVRSYDLESGDLLWECGGLGNNAIATPLAIDGVAIAMTGHDDAAGIAVPLDSRGDITGSDKLAWQVENSTPYIASPILYDDLLYFTKGRNAVLSIAEAKTGKLLVNQKRLPEQDTLYASPVGAAGRVYIPSREGTTVVIKHGREFEVLAINELDETIDASPAIVGKEIYLRGDKHLYCIAEE